MTGDIYVPAVGPDDAKVVLIGEAPGGDEEKALKPFIGRSGQLLRNVMSSVGIVPHHAFITNVCHYRPQYNDIKKFVSITDTKRIGGLPKVKPNKKVSEGIVELFHDLARVKPNVAVPLGNVALWALCGVMSIGKRRGSILELNWDMPRSHALDTHGLMTSSLVDDIAAVQGMKVIPSYHPAAILRNYNMLPVMQSVDFQRIYDESHTPELNLPEREYIINPEGQQLLDLWEQTKAADLISYDIECVGGTTLYCVGFSIDPSWGWTLTADNAEHMHIIHDILTCSTPKLAQNGLFDQSFLAMYSGIQVENYCEDTMVAQRCCYAEYPIGLDFITSVYTREPYYKDEGKNWSPKDAEDVERFLTYNIKDTCLTLEAFQAQSRDELSDELIHTMYRRLMDQVPAYVHQMVHGIRVDLGEMERLRRKYTKDAMELQDALDKVVGEHLGNLLLRYRDSKNVKKAAAIEHMLSRVLKGMGTIQGGLNVNSSKMLQEWLYGIRGMKVKRHKKTKKPSVDESSLIQLFGESQDDTLLTILKIRQYRKRLPYLNMKTDGRSYTYYSANPVKASTGRSAYSKTIQQYGLNVQTIPHELRTMYVPERGYSFSYFDYAQAEARIVAYTAGIAAMIKAFETGGDVHILTAEHIFSLDPTEIEEYPHRYLAKRCNHAFNYEMGPYKFWEIVNTDAPDTGIGITRSEAKQFRERHLRAYPELELYWQKIKDMLYVNRTVITPLGRKREFPGRLNNDTFRAAYSHYAQGTVADMVKQALLATYNYLRATWEQNHPDTRVMFENHDALLIQYPTGAEDELFPEIIKRMEIPFITGGYEITIPVDVAYGPNYGDLTKYASTPT